MLDCVEARLCKNARAKKRERRCCPSMALTRRKACWDDKSVCFAEALALQLNDFKCHHSEMIHSARVLNFGNDFPECATEQTDLSMCARLCICAYVSHEEEDTRIRFSLFMNKSRSPVCLLLIVWKKIQRRMKGCRLVFRLGSSDVYLSPKLSPVAFWLVGFAMLMESSFKWSHHTQS